MSLEVGEGAGGGREGYGARLSVTSKGLRFNLARKGTGVILFVSLVLVTGVTACVSVRSIIKD